MIQHHVKVHPSRQPLPKTDQLAWKIAEVAAGPRPLDEDVAEMLVNRVIDNAAVAIAAINRTPVANARTQALAHPRPEGATLFGLPASERFECEWAAWANGVAVRELDMHDTFLAADYSHPADNIPPLVAVAQQCGRSGRDLLFGLAVAYEIQMDLVRGICLHRFKKDHVAHLAPSVAAGIGAMLGLEADVIYQAVQQAVHLGFSTRQSRKGEISSWKAYAPAHTGKLAIEAVDRAMRGEKSPSPIYEGEDSVLAWMLGAGVEYDVPLPGPGEPCRAVLDSYTKEHSAEYQAQAWIDLALRLRPSLPDLQRIERVVIHTSHHTHVVIGSGSGDPQKMDPTASRETLDHSLMFIFAAALQTGFWHHVRSYAPEVVQHPDVFALWQKIQTVEDAKWTARYHASDPRAKAFGGRVEITFTDGTRLTEEIVVADAHPLGGRPFARADYVRKFRMLTDELISPRESERFLGVVPRLAEWVPGGLGELNLAVDPARLACAARDQRGIF